MSLAVPSLLLTGACSGGGDSDGAGDRPGATVPTAAGADSSTSSTSAVPGSGAAAIDITTKPATITVEYADAVMDELDRLLSDAIREFVAADGPTKSFDDKLNAVYDEPSLEIARSDYGALATDGTGEFRDDPGLIRTKVLEVMKNEPGCVVLATERTFADLLSTPPSGPTETTYVALTPKVSVSDPSSLNSTPWSVVFDGGVLDADDPRNAC